VEAEALEEAGGGGFLGGDGRRGNDTKSWKGIPIFVDGSSKDSSRMSDTECGTKGSRCWEFAGGINPTSCIHN
jgi:hypothetical protein